MNRIISSFLALLCAAAPAAAQTTLTAPTVACPPPTATAPVWGKLVIAGNVVTCYYATGTATPTTWTKIGTPQTIGFVNNPLLVGMYITSRDGTGVTPTLATGTIDNFTITPAPKYRLVDCDIGAPKLMGCANLIGSVWNLSGSGAGIAGTSDQFNFQPWLVWGDCTVVCRLTSLTTSNVYGKIGIMVRDGYNTGSDYALFCATKGAGLDFQYRLQFVNNPDETPFVAPPAPGTVSSIVTGYGLSGTVSYILRP